MCYELFLQSTRTLSIIQHVKNDIIKFYPFSELINHFKSIEVINLYKLRGTNDNKRKGSRKKGKISN